MSFETDTSCVISPLDLNEGDKYNEPVNGDAHIPIIENIYQITWHREDYINPIMDGERRWNNVNSYDIYLGDSMERWENNLYKVSTRRYARTPKSIHWIGYELCDKQSFDGIGTMDTFLSQMERIFPED